MTRVRPGGPGARSFAAVALCAAIIAAGVAWRMATIEYPAAAPSLHDEVRSVTVDRLAATILIGACLGIAGVLLRTATRNPLADPDITGVNAGAAFGAVAVTAATGAVGGAALLPGAIAGASVAAGATVFFGLRGAGKGSSKVAVQRMVLLGIAVSALFSALSSIVLVLDEAQLATVLSWLSGRLGGVRMGDLVPALIAAAVVVPVVLAGSRGLDALGADDDVAGAVGANPATVRLSAVAGAVLLVAPAVAASGPIGFLGLMAATAARRVCGPRHRLAVPVAAFAGAAVLLVADGIGRMLSAPAETPVGIVTAIAGVPVLLWGIAGLDKRAGGSRGARTPSFKGASAGRIAGARTGSRPGRTRTGAVS